MVKKKNKLEGERDEQKGMLNYVLIRRDYVNSLSNVSVKLGMARGISDYYLVKTELLVKGIKEEWR